MFVLRKKRAGNRAGNVEAPASSAAKAVVKPKSADSGRPSAVLRDLTGSTGQPEHLITADMVQLGRAPADAGTGVQSVVVQVKTVGRRHAMIEYRKHTFWLVDQGSLNGTYVDNQRVAGETALRPGAYVRLDEAEFEFALPEMVDSFSTVAINAAQFLETLEVDSPEALATSAMEADAQPSDETAPASTEDIEVAKRVTGGAVDFDVFSDSASTLDEPEVAKASIQKKKGGLIDSYLDD
jgi:hypothetical protein